MRTHLQFLILSVCLLARQAVAWGVVGHEIVGTIAQIFLHDSAEAAVKDILPPWTKGQLASVAAWADRVRMHYHWSGPLHYVSPLGDHPPDACAWGGEVKNEHNVLSAVLNYTHRVHTLRQDEDLRFLVHYVGDMHQPLHLMERERGGNGDPVLFEHRHYSLHGIWDSQMLSRTIREQHNYTRPGPSRRVEETLRGTIYDPYIRLIVYEGLRDWWRTDVQAWTQCASAEDISHILDYEAPQKHFGSTLEQQQQSSNAIPCPTTWSEPSHALTCKYVFPEGYDASAQPLMEVGGEYYQRIKRDNVLELQLAQAGIRLAAILNSILADPEEVSAQGLLQMTYVADDFQEIQAPFWDVKKWLNL